LLRILSFFGGAAWSVFMSTFNTLIQKLAPDWVRARVLAIYLLVFQGSIALGSALWGVAADHTSASGFLMLSSVGIALCLVRAFARDCQSLQAHWTYGITGEKFRCFSLPSLRPEIPVAMCIMASNPR
jgi:hypothetical protein